MTDTLKLELSLLLMRVAVFVVMLMWTVDKLIRPQHAAAVFKKFYFIADLGPAVMYSLAALELLILCAFVLGLFKTWSYGAVLAFHTVSTFSSLRQYLAPFDGANLLFFAAWPMWAACICLFLLRNQDRRLTWGG